MKFIDLFDEFYGLVIAECIDEFPIGVKMPEKHLVPVVRDLLVSNDEDIEYLQNILILTSDSSFSVQDYFEISEEREFSEDEAVIKGYFFSGEIKSVFLDEDTLLNMEVEHIFLSGGNDHTNIRSVEVFLKEEEADD